MDSLKIGSDKSNSLFEIELDSYEQDEFLESLSKNTTRKKRERAKILTRSDFGGALDKDEYADALTEEEKSEIENAKDKKEKERLKEGFKKKKINDWNDRVRGVKKGTGSGTQDTEQATEPNDEVRLQEARNKQFINRLNKWQQALNLIKVRNGGKNSGSFDTAVENIKSLMFASTKPFSLHRVGPTKTPAYIKRLETVKETIQNLDKALAELLEESEKEVETKVIRNMAETSGKMLRYIDNEAGVAFEKGLVTTWATILEYSQGEYSEVEMQESEEEKEKREKAAEKEREKGEKERKKQEAAEEKERNKRIEKKKKEKQKEEKKQGKEVTKLEEIILTEEEKEKIDLEINEERQKREAERFDINKLIADGKEFASLRGNPSFVVSNDFLKQLTVIQSMNGIVGEKESDFSNMIFTYEKDEPAVSTETEMGTSLSESTAGGDRKLILTGVRMKSKGRTWKAASGSGHKYEQDERYVIEYLSTFGLTGKTMDSDKYELIKHCSIRDFEQLLRNGMVAEDVVKRVTAQFVIAKYRLQGEDGFSEDKSDIQRYLYYLSQYNSQAVEMVDGFYQPKMTTNKGFTPKEGETYDLTLGEAGGEGFESLAGDLTKAFLKLFIGKTRLAFKGIDTAKTQA